MNDQQSHPEDLLPWYVNGSLSDEERTQVEAHVSQCATCASEIAFLKTMSEHVQQDTKSAPAEFLWHRLRRDLRHGNKTATGRRGLWVPAIAAAAMLVIVVQAVVLFNVPQGDGYHLAGGKLEGTVLQVKFNPDVTEKKIRSVLQSVNGDIVSGPGANGVYRIRLPDSDARILQQQIDSLKANHNVIDYLERD